MNIKEAYERFKHMDPAISSMKIDYPGTTYFKDFMLYELWQAIKSEVEK